MRIPKKRTKVRSTKVGSPDPSSTNPADLQHAAERAVATSRKRSEDQRTNLKRSYRAFLESVHLAGGNAAAVPSPSDVWPRRPYAASM